MSTEERVRQMMERARGEEEITGAQWEGFSGAARRSIRMQRLVAAGVGLVLVAAVVIGATTILGSNDNKGLVTPIGPDDGKANGCQDIDAPWNPDACNYDPDAAKPPPISPTTLPTDFEAKPPPIEQAEIWLVDPTTGKLSWGIRTVPGGGDSLTIALQELLRGPIGPDVEAGIATEIPAGTELVDTEIVGEGVHITLSSEFDDSGTESPGTMRLREAQVVFTATQIGEIESVRLFVEEDAYLGQVEPVGRDDFDDVAPPIVVESPKIGQQISGPTFEVTGTANVFEGTVHFDLDVPAPVGVSMTSFTTATCGSGCRGDFTETVKFDPQIQLEKPIEAILTVYEESAEDGSRINEVTLPLTLVPWE